MQRGQDRLVVQPRPAGLVVGVAERDGQLVGLRQTAGVVEQMVHSDRRRPGGQLWQVGADAGLEIDAAVEHGPSTLVVAKGVLMCRFEDLLGWVTPRP